MFWRICYIRTVDLGLIRDATFFSSLVVKVEQAKDRFLKVSGRKIQTATKTVGATAHLNENEMEGMQSLD
jgi:hypothetical protein